MLARVGFKLIAPIIVKVMENPLPKRLRDPIRALNSAGVRPAQQVLEVGCGTGFFTIPAAKLVGEGGCVHAIDIRLTAIQLVTRKAQDAGVTNLVLSRANAVHCPLPRDSMDLVLLFGVIPSPSLPLDRLLPEMHRVVRPEGGLALWTAFPCWSSANVTWGGLFTYLGEEHGVHKYRKVESAEDIPSRIRPVSRQTAPPT
jgi:ubiquinone/menaquinone biosynthesis C-methylase UbiE